MVVPSLQYCRSCSSSFSQWLDCLIRCSFHHCNRPWSSIQIATLEHPNDPPRIKTSSDYRLSSPNQWHGRAVSSPAEGCPEGPTQPHVMDGRTATGTSRHSDSTEGGHILYRSRDGVRYNSPSSWHIFHPLFHSFIA